MGFRRRGGHQLKRRFFFCGRAHGRVNSMHPSKKVIVGLPVPAAGVCTATATAKRGMATTTASASERGTTATTAAAK